MTARETLEQLIERTKNEKRRAEYEAQLAVPPMPKALAYLYAIYWRIRRRKGGTGFGISPIELPDIASFMEMAGTKLAPWEVAIIETLDDLFVGEYGKTQAARMQEQRRNMNKDKQD